MAKILDGKIVRDKVAAKLEKEIGHLKIKPALAIIQIGDLAESNAYIKQKKLFGARIGARVDHIRLPQKASEETILSKIKKLNLDRTIDGIIVQMPIPGRLNKERITEAVDVTKDVDGLHSENVQKLFSGKSDGFTPATARGVMELLKYYKIPLSGKNVLVIGRSTLVGKPVALSALNQNATVTIAHSQTKNLGELTKAADIIVSAAGRPNLIVNKHVKRGQVVIDVGINVIKGKVKKLEEEIPTPKMIGDVDFKSVSKIVKAISPVPGGVGPMTVASLFENLLDAYKIEYNQINYQ